ncbi:hypothetical protein BT96DRAFT_960358 [Gymnopus androsaceus JB14]|uniref:Uncharacterized protein n=1 Tax=Gymnopus androsaceus JB14 TaxID=1447944 RepID=A0A6A4GR32_9AGAR|nr:hypothetical protein BT96DRAFT_960358 [Gymnopus androsaceus JB14]
MRRESEGDPDQDGELVGELLQELEEENNHFHFVPLEPESPVGVAGPGPSTQAHRDRLAERQLGGNVRTLDDGDLLLFEVEHQSEGAVVRMDQSLHDWWRLAHHISFDVPMDGSSSPPRNIYAPFASEMDWRVAEWVVKNNVGHNSFDRFLQIPGVIEKLGLSYHNVRGLHKCVDSIRPKAGDWKVRCLRFKDCPDEEFILRHRNILDVIKSLWGDPLLAQHLVYRPKSIFKDAEKKQRTYSEMWSSKWWQFMQQVCVLLAYLPVEKLNKDGLAKREASGCYQRLFHEAMRHVVSLLVAAGKDGVEMASADGEVRRVHPILASYVADFPKQCMVTCSKYGTCPKCHVDADHLSDAKPSSRCTNAWTLEVMQEARASSTSSAQYFKSCMDEEVSGYTYHPFWDELPFCDIHFAITPDVLHQLYQEC